MSSNFVTKLNGMFSIQFATNLILIVLFRDRMGIKPLFYTYKDDELIFASELKAIDKIKTNKQISHESIYSYLHLGYIPANKTIYNDILKVKPGSYLVYKEDELKEIIYWKTENKISHNSLDNFNLSKKKLEQLLEKSIKSRLISDVPIGTFLSGGTDSSLVSAIAQKVNDKTINTFSIGFDDAKHNLSIHAKKYKYLGTNHYEFILKEEDALIELESIMEHFDEPFADSSALPTMLVSKMARKYVTVCLSGDGGDELFMGYGAYTWAKRINHPIMGRFRYPISKFLKKASSNQKKRGALVFESPKRNWKSHIFTRTISFYRKRN